MRRIFKSLFLPILLFAVSCDDALDVNKDPLAADQEQVSENLGVLFSGILPNICSNRVVETNINTSMWVQQIVSGGSAEVFLAPERYNLSPFYLDNTWSTFYVTGLKNAKMGEELALEQGMENTAAQFILLQAFIYYHITYLWEDAPFTEAVQPNEFLEPEYDSQQVVLKGMLDRIEKAIGMINPEKLERISDEDLIFRGDLEKWVKFGNSLKLRLLMTMADKDSEAKAKLKDVLRQPLIVNYEDEAQFDYFQSTNNSNQLWKLHNQYSVDSSGNISGSFFFASEGIIEMMQRLGDPRLSVYFDEGKDAQPGQFVGVKPGSTESYTVSTVLSLNIIRPDYPDRWITSSEVFFFVAEAILKGWVDGTVTEANQYLRIGVERALDWFDNKPGSMTIADKQQYIRSLPDLNSLPKDKALEAVYTQQYLESFLRGVYSFVNMRRNKFPNLSVPEEALVDGLICRLPWSPDSEASNPNVPAPRTVDEPMWFQK
ncbi:SusD/RagB family nutrient-binding outer membrane lipoprotein [Aureibacter tunicatorum]|uniref:SusD/RagB family nutrient-binding outer membrane lipoprotein n=1 Tax=Aureibacter tunicatorum TaxID=866807 RepID=A0AAE3XI89_9BACT|nr:SusD/RagB family nutrient-binding outer membrane lipoprotein [Aureibacter tunicatorum]MDR6238191.1 hypothetical protein [Aureibacter tunicatorum]